jgi:endonuclease/exonuclease/phosphatase family metal-dependent hydrolase
MMQLSRRTVRILVGGLAIVAISAWLGSWRLPVGASAGTGLHAAVGHGPVRKSDGFRVATWNIHSGRGRDGKLDLDRIARRLAGYDFVGLNEVRGAYAWWGTDQAEALGRSIDRAWLFLPCERRWGRDDFGNAALSASPVARWLRLPLPHTRARGLGNMTLFHLDVSETPVRIIVTHIDRREDTAIQLQAVSSLFLGLSEPAILMGDLNVTADDPRLADLLHTSGVSDVLTATRNAADERIDWIFVRGLECLASGLVDHGESDHPLAWAELRLPAPASSEGMSVPPRAAVGAGARSEKR